MKKFEYRVEVVANGLELERKLNQLGEKGWEAFGVNVNRWTSGNQSISAYLKREKPTKP